ncbi:short-chain dehydrogenase/reductase [Pectobacterium carotovorum subsp. carotovorum]|nr:short-chain dehydrogenase/reductase [Pectobacterium carotovorum subsp. carotovorum]
MINHGWLPICRKSILKTSLVTGASSGIGEASARKRLSAGYTVYGTSLRGAQAGQQPFPLLVLDVTDEASVESTVNELLQREGHIDLLVNNAGFDVSPAAAEESSIEQAKAIFDTNFLGTVRMIRAVAPHMRRQGSGRIINIGSNLGIVPMPYVVLYAASKHAIEGYSEALDHELHTYGIRVSVIEPADTRTQFEANNLQPDAKLEEYEQIRANLANVVAQAMMTADEPAVVANIVLHAAQDKQPRLRYTAGKAAKKLQFLRRFALASVMESGIRKNLQLDVKKSS